MAQTAHAAAPADLLSALTRRYAVKKFDPEGKISPEAWDALEQSLVLAPSSFGLQPFRFFVVQDQALRARLREASWNQSQITDADKLVVFAANRKPAAADVERFIARIAEVRGVSTQSLDGYKNSMLGKLSRGDEARNAQWAARQTYIALGVFLASAAALGVDACPMEGFEPARYDELLGLGEKGYTAVCVATAGVRASDDDYARLAKVRLPRTELVTHV